MSNSFKVFFEFNDLKEKHCTFLQLCVESFDTIICFKMATLPDEL